MRGRLEAAGVGNLADGAVRLLQAAADLRELFVSDRLGDARVEHLAETSAVGTDPSRATLVYKTSCLHVIKFHY